MAEPSTSHIAYLLLLNVQWFFIGLSILLGTHDVVEFVRSKKKRYLSYAFGRFFFASLVGVIGVLLALSPKKEIPWSPELIVWIVSLVGVGQAVIVRLWEIREIRRERIRKA